MIRPVTSLPLLLTPVNFSYLWYCFQRIRMLINVDGKVDQPTQ